VPETAVDTQLGLGQVRSGSGISINRGLAIDLFFMDLKPSRNAWRRLRIGAFPFQLSRVGGIFKFSDLLALKRAFKWFTGRIKTLRLALWKEFAIESFKRNSDIRISHRIF
jgi:hypothetical protein